MTHASMSGRSIFHTNWLAGITNTVIVTNDNCSLATNNGETAICSYNRSQLAAATAEEMSWMGRIESGYIGLWIDQMLLIILGGVPWQVEFIGSNQFSLQ